MISLRLRAMTVALTGAVVALTLSDPALAAVRGPHESTPLNLPAAGAKHAASVGPGGGGLAKTFVGLAVVVAVIYGLYWILRQVKTSREDRGSGHGLSSEASIPLGPGRSLHLVRAGRELVLVGVAEHGVTPIRSYTEEEATAIGLIGHDGDDSGDGTRPSAPASKARRSVVDLARQLTVRR